MQTLDLNISEIQNKDSTKFWIKEIEYLLESRKEEYKTFGATKEDTDYDNKLKSKLEELKTLCKHLP